MNKKGVQMAIDSIIIIILAIVILVVMVVGFAGTTQGMFDKLNSFGGDDVEAFYDACKVSCARENVYAYCSGTVDYKDEATGKMVPGQCSDFVICEAIPTCKSATPVVVDPAE